MAARGWETLLEDPAAPAVAVDIHRAPPHAPEVVARRRHDGRVTGDGHSVAEEHARQVHRPLELGHFNPAARPRFAPVDIGRACLEPRLHRVGRADDGQVAVDRDRDPEAVRHHPEARRPEGLAQRHLHLAAFCQRAEHGIGARCVGNRDRKRETSEMRLARADAIGGHGHGVADPESRVHHFVLRARGNHPRWRGLWAVPIAHQHRHFGAERAAIKVERLFAAPFKE